MTAGGCARMTTWQCQEWLRALDAELCARYFRHVTCGYCGGFVARIHDRDVWEHNKDTPSGTS